MGVVAERGHLGGPFDYLEIPSYHSQVVRTCVLQPRFVRRTRVECFEHMFYMLAESR